MGRHRSGRRNSVLSDGDANEPSAGRIVGYNAREEIAIEAPVPTRKLREARKLARVPETDSELLGAYPLSEAAAQTIADVPPGLSYFLEHDPDEVPELTKEYFEQAAIYDGDALARPARGQPHATPPLGETDLFLMVNLRGRSTGLPMNIWIGPRGHARHAARIKVQMDHRQGFHIDRLAVVSVEDNPPQVIEGSLSATDLDRVRQYIALNKRAILDHWRERTDGAELTRSLKALRRQGSTPETTSRRDLPESEA